MIRVALQNGLVGGEGRTHVIADISPDRGPMTTTTILLESCCCLVWQFGKTTAKHLSSFGQVCFEGIG